MYRFNRNRYLLAYCCVLAGIELGTGLAWMVRVAHTAPAWQEAMWNEESKWPIEISITISVILDTSIAASTCYQLWRSRMMGLKRTRRMIDKLMRWTTQTGALTIVVSLAIVLTKKLDRKGNSYLWLGIALVLPNCYATGLLALLNART
ncbi:hypothetical protein BD779DRAFT_1805205, partial [Infundibulicybe gibba]